MVKKKSETVTNATYIREIVKKIKELDTQPSEDLRELIRFAKLLPMDFKFTKPDVENLEKVKSKLPLELQEFISDSDKDIEIDNYYALFETVTNLRRCAEYLITIVSENKESREFFGEMSLGAFEFYQRQRKELNKKIPPKHKMLNASGKRWLKHSPEAKARRNPAIPLFIAAPTFYADFALDFESTYLMKVLKGIDVRRLKICDKCSHVFWAYQLNKKYCDGVCQKRAKRSRAYRRLKGNKE